MRTRQATPADAAALVPLFAAWGHPLDEAGVAERLAAWAGTPCAQVLVAEDEAGAAAGVAAVAATPHLARPGSTARLAGLAVADGHRRRGVGRALVRAAEELARGWGCDRVELTSSRARDAAHAFYPALGYREASDSHARYVREL